MVNEIWAAASNMQKREPMKLNLLIITFLLTGATFAAEAPDLARKNATIEKLDGRMAARGAKVELWKNSGAVGEAASGMIEQIAAATARLSLLEKKEIRDLIVAENEDRSALLRELALAHGRTDVDAFTAAFARARRDAAAPGQMVQHPSSKEWMAKKDLRE